MPDVDRKRYRCPVCRVIFPAEGYVCRGSWPIYDPARPYAVDPPHDPVDVVHDPQLRQVPLTD